MYAHANIAKRSNISRAGRGLVRAGLASRAFRRAFTLIELLVVIVILAILAALIVPNVLGHKEDAQQAAAISDITEIKSQLDIYNLHMGSYPDQSVGLRALVEKPQDDPNGKWRGPYLKSGVLPRDPWGKDYTYQFDGNTPQVFTVTPSGVRIPNQ